jgi:hypothetical protein
MEEEEGEEEEKEKEKEEEEKMILQKLLNEEVNKE